MNTKMILTDLDHTLLRSDGSISEYTKQVLKKCQNFGIPIVIATSRNWIGAERYIEEILPDYEITTDGTLIHQRGKQVYSCNMDTEIANQIIRDLMEQNPNTEITVANGLLVFWNSLHISESDKLYKAVFNDYSKPLDCQVNKILAELPDSATAEEIAKKYHCRLQSYRGENWYAFLPEKSGKIQAIHELAKLLNISLTDIVSFGDDINDMEMLQICGTGVAVSNAVKDVKAVADCVTLSNDEDGVAVWIEKNILMDLTALRYDEKGMKKDEKKIKAIITDLDRTLLRTDKTVSDYTNTVLKKCHDMGIILMAATARPERAILTYNDQIDFEAVTTLNGARIVLPYDTIENGINPSSVEAILKKVIKIPGLVLSLETGAGIFSNVQIPLWNATVFDGFPALPTESIIFKILLSSEEKNIQQEVKEALTPDTYMTVAEGRLIQIMSAEATKWNGIKAMLEAVGVRQDEAVYFGDDYDDIEPIKNCGVGVAVSNAIDEVLEAADFITESNDEDGVAGYIEKNLL
ncbi:MAG: HAD family hydrolase [Lachnospiraceae bacterium]|nr:HAD family hydrolase [Lachnospiraceae bacterium]